MRVDALHTGTRRVEPVDRQNRRDQRRKDDERSEREQQEEAYILNLTRGKVGNQSPFISGAYTRAGVPTAKDREQDAKERADKERYQAGSGSAGSRLDTYS